MNSLPDDHLLLPRLLVGLEALHEQYQQQKFYPYPPTLSIAWNALTLRLLAEGKVSPPIGLTDLLRLCTKPVGEWFPAPLPTDFSSDIRLLYSGGGIELTDTSSQFLSDGVYRNENIRNLADAAGIERVLQNNQFVELLLRLRNATNKERAQRDYVHLRRFLITKPFATTEEIRTAFATSCINSREVGAFYRDCKPEESYYSCSNCGPLRRVAGKWRGAKPDVCSEHSGDNITCHAMPYRDGLRYLCAAIHERVCLHGIEEVRWLDTMHHLQENKAKARNALTVAEDWPGIDTYDLRLAFMDGTIWAADMKDHRDPDNLGKALEPISFASDALRYDQAFYVIPDRRENRMPGYCHRMQKEAHLPANHQILTASAFEEAVEQQLSRRKRRERPNEPNNAL